MPAVAELAAGTSRLSVILSWDQGLVPHYKGCFWLSQPGAGRRRPTSRNQAFPPLGWLRASLSWMDSSKQQGCHPDS